MQHNLFIFQAVIKYVGTKSQTCMSQDISVPSDKISTYYRKWLRQLA